MVLKFGDKVINQSQKWKNYKMEKLQNKALRIINFKPLRYSVNSLYNKYEILNFVDSIKLANFLYAHDNLKGNLPTTFVCWYYTFGHVHINRGSFWSFDFCSKNQLLANNFGIFSGIQKKIGKKFGNSM